MRLSTGGVFVWFEEPWIFLLMTVRVFLQIATAGLPFDDGEEPRFLGDERAAAFLQIFCVGRFADVAFTFPIRSVDLFIAASVAHGRPFLRGADQSRLVERPKFWRRPVPSRPALEGQLAFKKLRNVGGITAVNDARVKESLQVFELVSNNSSNLVIPERIACGATPHGERRARDTQETGCILRA